MNFKSLLNKRNYNYLFQLIKPYSNSVINKPSAISEITGLDDLSDYFEITKYDKLVVVASGPSSNKIKLEENALYICTNNSIQLVENKNFIYVVHDPYYLTIYLKSFAGYSSWKGTIFWILNNESKINSISFQKVFQYLSKKSRAKKELLITNFSYNQNAKALDDALKSYLVSTFDFQYQSINSGFNCLLLAGILGHINTISVEVYGLDMGEGGDTYFNKKAPIGKSIKGEKNKLIVKDFLQKAYQSKMKITNYSNFMNYENNK